MILTSFLQTAFNVRVFWRSSSTEKYILPLTRKHQITYIHCSPALALEISKHIWNDLQELYEHMPVWHYQDFLILVYPLKKKLNT